MAQLSTYDDVKNFFEVIMDDSSFGNDFVMDLFAQAETELAMERAWEALTVYLATISYASGDTYLTNYTLPTSPAFLYPVSVNLDRSVAENKEQERMSDRYIFKDDSRKFFVDYRSGYMHLGGTRNQSGTI